MISPANMKLRLLSFFLQKQTISDISVLYRIFSNNYTNVVIQYQIFKFFFFFRDTIDHLKSLVLKHGSDCWWTLSEDELLPPDLVSKVCTCVSNSYYLITARGHMSVLVILFPS
jgi:hypothetical protein